MDLAFGARVGVYEIITPIGEGGMGQVFRGRDTKLDRDVAIKILPDAFAHDSERLARFQREAKTLASLNHPHIAAIYGLEDDGGVLALVMELVEGEDLSQRIARGAIPIEEALPIAKQIAEALEAAHEQGIIHRDLKPANIKVRADGVVKVLDFGLAKAMEPISSSNVTQSPTITTPAMTQVGTILGTAAYMSPEQARGKAVDKRADIWAFGCVLYEMLTGRRLFAAEDVPETLAAVLTRDVGLSALSATTPPRVRRLLARCLERDPHNRLRDIGEARVELDKTIAGAADGAGAAPSTASATAAIPRGPLAWITATASVLVAAALAIPAVRHLRETPPPIPPETRVDIATATTDQPSSFALSPDGRQIVFVASGDDSSRLWLRSLATTTAQPLAGTEGATYPFWSPDSRSVGFYATSALKRIDLGGGAPQILAPAASMSGGTWNADGVIVFAPGANSPLMRVSASAGTPAAVTTLGPQQSGHRFPHFLPDGHRFLFLVRGAPDVWGIYLGALDGRAPIRLTPAASAGMYLAEGPRSTEASRDGGWLLWVRASTLVAQRLDLGKSALAGEPFTLADRVTSDGFGASAVSVAATGLLAYRTGGSSQRRLTWVDRSGAVRGTVGGPNGDDLNSPRVSPDGSRVAVSQRQQGNTDLFLMDGTNASRLTFDAAIDRMPVWAPDGTRLAFGSDRTGSVDLYQKRTNGTGVEERLVASDQASGATSWSPDGRFLLYQSMAPQTSGDLWVVPMLGDRKPSVFLKTPVNEVFGAFSPNGRWVAYQSNESGRAEVYVRPFVPPGATPASAGQWQVSTAGGISPAWRPDGKELFYLNPAGAMMAAPITVTGATPEPGAPVVLFPTRIYGGGVDMQQGRQYDVGPDGRFLINTELESVAAPIRLVMNWQPGAKK